MAFPLENGGTLFLEVRAMAIPNPKRELNQRLRLKSLDAQFCTEIEHGLNCSPFEATCVLDVLKEIYSPFLAESSVKAPPMSRPESRWPIVAKLPSVSPSTAARSMTNC